MSRSYQSKLYRQVEHFTEQLKQYHHGKYRDLVNLMQKYESREMPLLTIYEKLVILVKDEPTLLKSYDATLHSELKTRNNNTTNELESMFHTIFKSLKSNFPEMYHKLVELIAGIAKKSFKKEDSMIEQIKKLKNLINNYPDENQLPRQIRLEITQILDTSLKNRPPYQQILSQAEKKEPIKEQFYEQPYEYYDSRGDYKEPKPKPVKNKSKSSYNSRTNMLKNENYFFENLKSTLDKSQYSCLVKLILLYNKCIISFEEMCLMGENILRTLDKQLWLSFKEITESRNESRKKDCPFYKSAVDIEDKESNFGANFNQSYKKIPSHFPFIRNSTTDKIALENINTEYTGCMFGADKTTAKRPYDEGVLKKNFIKNSFEEAMFHIEDERYEIDVNIARFRMVIKWLEKLSQPDLTEKQAELYYHKILKFDVLQKIYQSKAEEYFTAVRDYREEVLPKVMARVKKALELIIECKKKYEEDKWDENISKNFYRSLDPKSFSIKFFEKRTLVNKNFVQEVPTRISNMKSIFQDLKKLLIQTENVEDFKHLKTYRRVVRTLQPYNTFFGISKNVKCASNKFFPEDLLKPLLSESQNLNVPVFSFSFNKKKVCEDALSICYFYLLFGKGFNSNKQDVRDRLTTIVEGFLGITCTKEFNQDPLFNSEMLNKLSEMEDKLFPKNYSYANCVKEKFSSKSLQKADKQAKGTNGKKNKDDDDDEDGSKSGVDDPDKVNNDQGDDEEDENDKDSFDKLIDESSNDSNKEIRSKMMKFQSREMMEKSPSSIHQHTDYYPKPRGKGKVFYSGQNFYLCFRFFYTLYERFLMAYELSLEIPKNENTSELTEEQKRELSEERYSIFIELVRSLVKENLDSAVYEDSLRCVFGNEAGIFFSLDKVMSNVLKSLPHDELSKWVIEQNNDLFGGEKNEEEFADIVKFSKTVKKMVSMTEQKGGRSSQSSSSNQLSNLSLYRIFFDQDTRVIYINIHSSMFKNWSHKGIKANKKYFETYVTNPTSEFRVSRYKSVFLKRCLKRGRQNFKYKEMFNRNRIAYKTLPNTFKLVPCGTNREDIFFRKNQERNQKNYIRVTLKKICKFRKWLQERKKMPRQQKGYVHKEV